MSAPRLPLLIFSGMMIAGVACAQNYPLSGLHGYESVGMTGLVAPAGTPAVIIRRLNQDVVRILAQEDVKRKFFNVGVEPIGNTPEEFAAAIKSNMVVLGKVIKDAGIRSE